MYIIKKTTTKSGLDCAWDGPEWQAAETLELTYFRPEGNSHHPRTQAKLLYNKEGILGIFKVEDRYVRCVSTEYGSPVYKDSCVEFFVRPRLDRGYFNFEFNCGGTLLCNYIIDPERTDGGFRDFAPVSEDDSRRILICHTLPAVIEEEIMEPVQWLLEFFIPFDLLEKYAGKIGPVEGSIWKANFYKCADSSSHPHWVSWQPLSARNFHLPDCFGSICLGTQAG